MDVGLFTTVRNTAPTIPAGTSLVRTPGYSTAGIGKGDYVATALAGSQATAYLAAHPNTSFQDASGRVFRLIQDRVNPYQFGALGAPTDDAVALQAYLNFVATHKCGIADWGGDFISGTGLVLDTQFADEATVTTNFEWGFRLTCKSGVSIDRLLTIRQLIGGRFIGRPHLIGTGGSASYSFRTCQTGVYLDDVARIDLDGFYFENFAFAGLETAPQPANSNSSWLGQILAKRCGSGAPATNSSLTASWSNPVRSGTTFSVGQRTDITVDTLPNGYIGANHVVTVEIGGQLYFVTNIDRTNSKIQVYPWTPAAQTTGTLTYHFGSVVELRGNDNNTIGWGQITGVGCGCSLTLATLYAGNGGAVLAASCGTGIRLGVYPTSTLFGGSISHLYCEGNTFDVALVGGGAWDFKILTSSAVTPSKIVTLYEARGTSGGVEVMSNTGFTGVTIGAFEGFDLRLKRPNGTPPATIDFNQAKSYLNQLYTGDSPTFALAAITADNYRLFGYDGGTFTLMGTGANGQPTGTVTFNPPTGQTVNGGASASFSVFTGPALFAASFNRTTSNWQVRVVAGK